MHEISIIAAVFVPGKPFHPILIFSTKADVKANVVTKVPHFKFMLLTLFTNIKLGCKIGLGTNILAYLEHHQ